MDKGNFLLLKKVISDFWFEREQECLICGQRSSQIVCKECQLEYLQPEIKRCCSCGKLVPSGGKQCQDCTAGKGPRGLNKVITLGHYYGFWKEYIHKIKYQGQPYLLIPLAELFLSWVISELPPPDRIVPVPMHANRLAERGFNQAEVFASVIGRKMTLSCDDILERYINTAPQALLGRQDRVKNVQGAFRIKAGFDVKDQVIWLMDDVTTTGTTIGECANVLLINGARQVFAVCLGAGKEDFKNISIK